MTDTCEQTALSQKTSNVSALETAQRRLSKKLYLLDDYTDADFQRDVHELANNPENFLFTNDDKVRSQITSSELFRITTSSLNYYTYGFRDNITFKNDKYGFLKNLEDCLNRSKSSKILIDEECSSTVYRFVKNAARLNENINIHVTNFDVKEKVHDLLEYYRTQADLPEDSTFHFLIGDNDKYRLEYDVTQKNAFINFKDSSSVLDLNYIFNIAFNASAPIKL